MGTVCLDGNMIMAKTDTLKLRLSTEEKQAFQEASALSGIALSAWIRERLRRAARSELLDSGRRVPFINYHGDERK